MCPDLAQFHQMGDILKVYAQLFESLLIIWQNVEPYSVAIGHIFIVTNGKILKNNIAIWSHCLHLIGNSKSKGFKLLTSKQLSNVLSELANFIETFDNRKF